MAVEVEPPREPFSRFLRPDVRFKGLITVAACPDLAHLSRRPHREARADYPLEPALCNLGPPFVTFFLRSYALIKLVPRYDAELATPLPVQSNLVVCPAECAGPNSAICTKKTVLLEL